MPDSLARLLLAATSLYLVVGVVFACPFVTRGAATIDPAARDATRGFRFAILPGAIALWPLLLAKWMKRRT